MGHLGLESRIVIVSKVQDPTLLGSYILSKRAVSRVCKASRITTSCFTNVQNFYLPKLNIGFPIVSFLPKIIFGNRITNWEF